MKTQHQTITDEQVREIELERCSTIYQLTEQLKFARRECNEWQKNSDKFEREAALANDKMREMRVNMNFMRNEQRAVRAGYSTR